MTRTPVADLDIDAMAASILSVYSSASDGQRADGMTWYAEAHALATELALSAGHTVLQAAGVIAAFSPRMEWTLNVRIARRTYAAGGITEGCLGMVIRKVSAIFDGADVLATLKAPKTSAFASVIADPLNNHDVVIDRHAMSVAYGRQVTDDEVAALNRKGRYDGFATAYRKAAAQAGITPSQMQAITWVVWRETNIRVSASVRRAAGRA